MHAIDTITSVLDLIAIGVPVWLALRPRNWGSYQVWVSTLEHFSSFDPWRGEILSDWNLELYLIAHVKSALPGMRARAESDRWLNQPPGPGKRRLNMVEALALRRSPTDAPHFLPRAMATLWLDGACPTDRLPWLLCDREPSLRNYDFHFAGLMMKGASYLSGIYAIVFAVLLGIYIFVVPPRSHRPRDIERSVFISEPQREQAVFLTDEIRLHDAVPWPAAMMRMPPGVRSTLKRAYEIGWYKASSGRRLLAIPIPQWNDRVEGILTRLDGTVWRTGQVGLTPEFLHQLQSRTPNLDVSYIAVDYWSWADRTAGGGLGDQWLALSLLPGIPAFGLFVFIVALRWRDRNLRQRLTRRLADVYRTAATA